MPPKTGTRKSGSSKSSTPRRRAGRAPAAGKSGRSGSSDTAGARADTAGSTARRGAKIPSARGKRLVVVESPAKARTVGQILGNKYVVTASMGHVRDLPKSTMGVDTEQDFTPKYLTMRDKRDLVKELKEAGLKASDIFLATDPDREGEAISWHLQAAAGWDQHDQIGRAHV